MVRQGRHERPMAHVGSLMAEVVPLIIIPYEVFAVPPADFNFAAIDDEALHLLVARFTGLWRVRYHAAIDPAEPVASDNSGDCPAGLS